MPVAKKLHIRLFLEGIEIPVISAKVTCGTNEGAQAVLQIIPTDNVHNFLPRTLVHLFFYDADDVYDSDDDRSYKIMFAGEVLGYQFMKTPAGRNAILFCHDFSSYWDAAKLYFKKSGSVSSDDRTAAFAGATIRKYGGDDSGGSPASIIYRILKTAPNCIPGLRGLLGGMLHMLESIGGLPKGKKRFRGLNDFFSAAELRLKLAQMLGASAKDTTSVALFKSGEFRKWIKLTIGKKNAIITYRQVLELLLKRVFHQ